jgi:hypothetical protein
VRLCDALFFFTSPQLLEAHFHHVSAQPPFGQHFNHEGVLASLDSGQVGGSSGNGSALSSLQAPGPTLQRLDVRLRTR